MIIMMCFLHNFQPNLEGYTGTTMGGG